MNNIKFTNDEIRQFKGYEHLTNEQAEKIASFLELYAQIIYQELNKNNENR